MRERQVILRLPDPSQMRVEMKINESLVRHVRPGMPAAIEPIGGGGRNAPRHGRSRQSIRRADRLAEG